MFFPHFVGNAENETLNATRMGKENCSDTLKYAMNERLKTAI